MKIRKLVEQLKDEFKKEYGVKAYIKISVHSTNDDLSFKKANYIVNSLLGELGGKKVMGKSGHTIWLGNDCTDEGIAECSVFPEVIFDEK